jgi:hypothetical protein
MVTRSASYCFQLGAFGQWRGTVAGAPHPGVHHELGRYAGGVGLRHKALPLRVLRSGDGGCRMDLQQTKPTHKQ